MPGNGKPDKLISLCGRVLFSNTEEAEGLSNLSEREIEDAYLTADATGSYCQNCRKSI